MINLGGVIHINKTNIGILTVLLFLFFYIILYKRDLNHQLRVKEEKKVSLYKLINVAIKAAENGGKEVVNSKDHIKIKQKGLTKEGVIDSVTTADYLSHCSMIKTLEHFFSLKIISEEAKTVCDVNQFVNLTLTDSLDQNVLDEFVEEKDVTVWIDPLDATHEYTEKLYNYVTVMVCVAVKGRPIVGVIHRPFSNSTSWAWVNKAKSRDLHDQASRNGETLKIIVSRSHRGAIEEILHKNFKKKYQLIIAAGAGYKALELAKGHVDAYLHITAIKKWDICAGNAVINSLGGTMTTKDNEEIDYSDGYNVKNEKGLIATMTNHDLFLGKL